MIAHIYPDLGAFYAERGGMQSPELGFGLWWRDGGSNSRANRVSWVASTGDLYALESYSSRITLLGQTRSCRHEFHALGLGRLDCPARSEIAEILKGWVSVCGKPASLQWVRDRMAGYAAKTVGEAVTREGNGVESEEPERSEPAKDFQSIARSVPVYGSPRNENHRRPCGCGIKFREGAGFDVYSCVGHDTSLAEPAKAAQGSEIDELADWISMRIIPIDQTDSLQYGIDLCDSIGAELARLRRVEEAARRVLVWAESVLGEPDKAIATYSGGLERNKALRAALAQEPGMGGEL